MNTGEKNRVAMLIDCDNATINMVHFAIPIADSLGIGIIRKGYGAAKALTGKWSTHCQQLAIAPCLVLNGKNAADIALTVDAMELAIDDEADTFIIVSSDADYTYLCHKLKSMNKEIHVVGLPNTPPTLRAACHIFHEYCEQPSKVAKNALTANASEAPKLPQKISHLIRQIADNSTAGNVDLASLAPIIRLCFPGWTAGKSKPKTIKELLSAYSDVILEQKKNGGWAVRIRIDDPAPASNTYDTCASTLVSTEHPQLEN